jgi:hypothetical protein
MKRVLLLGAVVAVALYATRAWLPPTAVPFSSLLALYQRVAKSSRLGLTSNAVEGAMR